MCIFLQLQKLRFLYKNCTWVHFKERRQGWKRWPKLATLSGFYKLFQKSNFYPKNSTSEFFSFWILDEIFFNFCSKINFDKILFLAHIWIFAPKLENLQYFNEKNIFFFLTNNGGLDQCVIFTRPKRKVKTATFQNYFFLNFVTVSKND